MTPRLVVVVPTRNRATLAIAAAESVLSQPHAGVSLLVSDNSTDPAEVDRLAAFCRDRSADLRYVRPPKPLSMARHWDWAMDRARESPGHTHVGYLTDRMIVLPDELSPLVAVIAAHPSRVVVYSENRVEDHARPARLFLLRWTGRLVEIDSAELLRMSARMMFHPLPRMLNCVVPLETVEAIHARFGTTFASIAPDFCFTYRCLATVTSIAFFDRAPIVHYASDRSHGATVSRGEMNQDAIDFAANLEVPRNASAPVPEFVTTFNAIVHEYCFVRDEVKARGLPAPEFPPPDRDRYLQEIAREIDAMENPGFRQKMQDLLRSQGPFRRSIPRARLMQRLLRLPARLLPSAVWRRLFEWVRVYPPGDAPLLFDSPAAALECARRRRRRPHLVGWHITALAPGARPLVSSGPPRGPAS